MPVLSLAEGRFASLTTSYNQYSVGCGEERQTGRRAGLHEARRVPDKDSPARAAPVAASNMVSANDACPEPSRRA
ncbi:protein of unknown function [Methylocaldum szegediense]|uniref:Uncharacterized protein n=1 Tax=Methylocaldum szegediense TaxID=73780 RepID=A0ABM9I6S9_9GAMM|nr:protein of unknown function [Methylocaldum szegediense]